MKRIHEEPCHEEDADTEQHNGQVREDGRVDRAHVARHALDSHVLKSQENIYIVKLRCEG